MPKWLTATAALMALGLASSACSESDDGPYRIDLSAKADGSVLKIRGESNLPDGVRITVVAFRNVGILNTREPDTQVVGGKAALLKDGKFGFDADLDRTSIYDNLASYREVGEVSRNVTVCASLSPGPGNEPIQDDEDVISRIGPKGEKLVSSEQARTRDGWTSLVTSTAVPAPTTELEGLQPPVQVVTQVGEVECPF